MNHFHNAVFIFADMSLKEGECRFEIPSASWFYLYSRNRKYTILSNGIDFWLVEAKCIRSEVKVRCGDTPIVFLDGTTFSHMGCVLSGDCGLCFPQGCSYDKQM